MKSFRLDPDSVSEFLDSWPVLVVGGLLACVLAYVGMLHPWGRIGGVLLVGAFVGFRLREVAASRVREQYPGARWPWLLSVGFATLAIGVAARMAIPSIQGSGFDLAWLGLGFVSILAFVVANRDREDVTR